MSASDVYVAAKGEYLTYKPTSRTKNNNYTQYLDKLGFREGSDSNTEKRTDFIYDCKKHIDASDFRYACLNQVPLEYRKMVLDFLRTYGSKYWGPSPRDHLSEPDIMKGFLVPRDARRIGSRLVVVLEQFFACKASRMRNADRHRSIEKQHLRHINTRALTWPADISPKSGSNERPAFDDADYSSSGEPNSDINVPIIGTSEVRVKIKDHSHKSTAAADAFKQQAAEDSDIPLTFGRRRLSIDSDYVDDSDSNPSARTSRKRLMETRNTLAPISLSTHSPAMDSPFEGSRKTKAKRPRLKKRPAEAAVINERSAIRRSFRVPLSHSSSHLARPEDEDEDEVIILEHSPFQNQIPAVKVEGGSNSAGNRLNLSANIINSTQLIVRASTQTHIAPAIVCLSVCRNVHDLFGRLTSKCGIEPHVAEKISMISATYMWSGKQHRICKGDEDDFDMFCSILRKAWGKDAARFQDECEIAMLLHVDE